jgi:ribonuclease Z
MATSVTLTGTGTPLAVAGRAGPGVLVRAGDLRLQFDAGRSTTLRLADAGVPCEEISAVFITHHHSDHLTGLADLVLTRWVRGNRSPLPIVAPLGPASEFAERVLEPWSTAIAVRRLHSPVERPKPEIEVRPFAVRRRPELVWENGAVRVSTILVHHEPVVPAVAFRVDTEDGSIVISGDTEVCWELEELAKGCDVLVHEACRPQLVRAAGLPQVAEYHADAAEVGALAARLDVSQLMLTHLEPSPMTEAEEAGFLDDVRSGGFHGAVLVGRDLATVELDALSRAAVASAR